jgi:alpha-amylase
MIIASLFFALSLLLTLSPQYAAAKNTTEWQQLSIYQVLTDRFATSNQSSPECWIRGYCGGTWKGIQNNLDYIQGMGFEAIWISPMSVMTPVRNTEAYLV